MTSTKTPNAVDPLSRLDTGSYEQFKGGEWLRIEDVVSREVTVRVTVRGQGHDGATPLYLWAHPVDLENLVLGHVLLELCGEGQVPALVERRDENFVVEVQAVEDASGAAAPPGGGGGHQLLTAMDALFTEGGLWEATGCFHRIGLWDAERGELVRMAQDIGRHNCMDRLAGWALSQGVDPRGLVLVCSARLTASLALKARKLGAALAVSRSAITTGALEVAAGATPPMTVVGFAREGRLTVFADPDGRIAR